MATTIPHSYNYERVTGPSKQPTVAMGQNPSFFYPYINPRIPASTATPNRIYIVISKYFIFN